LFRNYSDEIIITVFFYKKSDKYIEFLVHVDDQKAAEVEVNLYCTRLLANPIMEDYEFELVPVLSSAGKMEKVE